MIRPDQLAKSGTEHGEQSALFCWANVARIYGFDVANRFAEGEKFDFQALPTGLPVVPELAWLHAIPNGGSRGDDEKTRAIRGGALKAEGVKSGVADVFLPVPIWQTKRHDYEVLPPDNSDMSDFQFVESTEIAYCGLYIEMKKPAQRPVKAESMGGVSEEQKEFGDFVKSQGYGWIVCYTWREAAQAIESYLNWGKS